MNRGQALILALKQEPARVNPLVSDSWKIQGMDFKVLGPEATKQLVCPYKHIPPASNLASSSEQCFAYVNLFMKSLIISSFCGTKAWYFALSFQEYFIMKCYERGVCVCVEGGGHGVL